MDCEQCCENMARLLEEEPWEEKEACWEHLKDCESCKKEWERLCTLEEALSSLTPESPPPGYHEMLMASVSPLMENKNTSKNRHMWVKQLAMSAVFFLIFLVGIKLNYRPVVPEDTQKKMQEEAVSPMQQADVAEDSGAAVAEQSASAVQDGAPGNPLPEQSTVQDSALQDSALQDSAVQDSAVQHGAPGNPLPEQSTVQENAGDTPVTHSEVGAQQPEVTVAPSLTSGDAVNTEEPSEDQPVLFSALPQEKMLKSSGRMDAALEEETGESTSPLPQQTVALEATSWEDLEQSVRKEVSSLKGTVHSAEYKKEELVGTIVLEIPKVSSETLMENMKQVATIVENPGAPSDEDGQTMVIQLNVRVTP